MCSIIKSEAVNRESYTIDANLDCKSMWTLETPGLLLKALVIVKIQESQVIPSMVK